MRLKGVASKQASGPTAAKSLGGFRSIYIIFFFKGSRTLPALFWRRSLRFLWYDCFWAKFLCLKPLRPSALLGLPIVLLRGIVRPVNIVPLTFTIKWPFGYAVTQDSLTALHTEALHPSVTSTVLSYIYTTILPTNSPLPPKKIKLKKINIYIKRIEE